MEQDNFNIVNEKRLLEECLRRIEKQLGWESSDSWKNLHFVRLSEYILEKQKVYISPTTLKRLWGKIPQGNSFRMNTLDQLAILIGYNNWLDFYADFQGKPLPENSKQSDPSSSKNNRNKKWGFVKSVSFRRVVIALLMLLMAFFITKHMMIQGADIKLVSTNLQIPFTAVIKYSLPFTKGFHIKTLVNRKKSPMQTNPTHGEKVQIQQKNGQINVMVQTPRLFIIQLFYKNRMVKEIEIQGVTDGWFCFVEYPLSDYKYFNKEEIVHDGQIKLTSEALADMHDLQASKLNFINISKTQISGDNFMLHAKFMLDSANTNTFCKEVYLDVIAEHGRISLPFFYTRCAPRVVYVFSEHILSGKTETFDEGLASFSSFDDFEKSISIEVQDQNIRFYENDSMYYSFPYMNKLGSISGVRFWFKTLGEIHEFRLVDLLTGESAYEITK